MSIAEQDFLREAYKTYDGSVYNTDAESCGVTAETLEFWRALYATDVDPGEKASAYNFSEEMLRELIGDDLFIADTEMGRQAVWKTLHRDCEPGIWLTVEDDAELTYDENGKFCEVIRMRCASSEILEALGFNPNALHASVAIGQVFYVEADENELGFIPCGAERATHLLVESRLKVVEAGNEAASVAGGQLPYTGLSVASQDYLIERGVLDFFGELPEMKRQFMLVPIPEDSKLEMAVKNCYREWQEEDRVERAAFKAKAAEIGFEQRMELLDMIDSEFADLQVALESVAEQACRLSEECSRMHTELIQGIGTLADGRCVVIEPPKSEMYTVQPVRPPITAPITEIVKALDTQREEWASLNELFITRSMQERARIEFAPRFIELQPVVQELGGLLHLYHANVTLTLPDDHELRTRSYTYSAKGLLACMRDLKQGRKDLYEAEDDIASEMMKLLDSDD